MPKEESQQTSKYYCNITIYSGDKLSYECLYISIYKACLGAK